MRCRAITRDSLKSAEREGLREGMKAVRRLASAGLAERAKAGMKVRQPLASMTIGTRLTEELEKILADEVNVKQIFIDKALKDDVRLDVVITTELRKEGIHRDIARMVQELRQKAGLQPRDRIAIYFVVPEEVASALRAEEKTFMATVGARSLSYSRPDKFDAEESGTWEGQEVWIGIRKG